MIAVLMLIANSAFGQLCTDAETCFTQAEKIGTSDKVRAADFYYEACMYGEGLACEQLGHSEYKVILKSKKLTDDDYLKKSEPLIVKACDEGSYKHCMAIPGLYNLLYDMRNHTVEITRKRQIATIKGGEIAEKKCRGNGSKADCDSAIWAYGFFLGQYEISKEKHEELSRWLCEKKNTYCHYAGEYLLADRNYFDAVEAYKKACNSSKIYCTELGRMYEEGKGIRQDDAKALENYGIACDAKDREGCEKYARLKKSR